MSYAALRGSEQPVPGDAHQNSELLVKDPVLLLMKPRLPLCGEGSLLTTAFSWQSLQESP